MTLQEAITIYLNAHEGIRTGETQTWYRTKLTKFAEAVEGERETASLTLNTLRQWRAGLMKSNLSPETKDGYLRAVKACLKWLHQEGEIPTDPGQRLERPKRPQVPPKRISREAVQALLKAAAGVGRIEGGRNATYENTRDYALIRFILATGARRGGVYGLRVQDLDLTHCSAMVHEKGSKARRVYFDEETAAAVGDYLAIRPHHAEGLVWLTGEGKSLTLSGLRQIVRRISERAGLPDVGTHRLRHTMAFESVARGVDPDLLRQQLGHADLKTTYDSYIRWTDTEREKAFKVGWL